jgi:hypothetical protein
LQIFLSAWALTPKERNALISRRNRNITRVWCYAPGYIYPDRADIAGIKEVTGFEARIVTPSTTEVMPTEFGRKLGLTASWGPKESIRPLFSVMTAPEDTLATYADGSPAVAVRHSKKGMDVFVGVPKLTPELIQALAKLAGVHVFTEGNKATVWATDKYLSLQVHEAGPLVIDTGKKGKVVDALDDKVVIGEGPKVTLTFKQGETRVLKY